MKNFKKLIKEAYLGNPLNEELGGTPQYYVKYTTQDGQTAKSGFMSKKEAIKKEEALVNSGVEKSEIWKTQKRYDLNYKPYTIEDKLEPEEYGINENKLPSGFHSQEDVNQFFLDTVESGDVVVYDDEEHTVQGIKNFDGDTMVSIRPKTKHWTGAPQDAFWVKPEDLKLKKEVNKEESDDESLNETAGTFGDGVTKKTKAKYDKAAKDEYGKPFAELSSKQKQEVMKAVVKYTGPEFDTDYTLHRKEMSDYMNEIESDDEKMERDQAIQSYKRLTDDDELKLKQIKAMLDKERGKTSMEEDMNDPVLIKTRAAKMAAEKEKAKQAALDKKYGPTFMDKLEAEIGLKQELQDLKAEYDDIINFQQENDPKVKPEGGEKADEYGGKLNKIDARMAEIRDELDDLRMYESVNEDEEFEYKAPKDTDGDDITIDPDTEFKVDLKHLVQKHKIEDVNEGTCGYTPDGKPRSKPAGPYLNEDDIEEEVTIPGSTPNIEGDELIGNEDLAENILKKIFGPKLNADVVTTLSKEISDIIGRMTEKDLKSFNRDKIIAQELVKGSNTNPKDLLKSFIEEESDAINESKEFNFNKMIKEALTPNYLK